MKVLLIYYTGTYNTRYLSSRIEEKFIKNGCEVDKVEISADSEIPDTTTYDYVGFGYPIYGFNSPLPFNKFFRKLKFKKGQKYFIYKNSGETFGMNNASSRIILRRMKRKKGVFTGEYHFVMPYNIHFEFDKDFIYQIIKENRKLLDVMFYNLKNKIYPEIKSNMFYNAGAFLVGVQKIGGSINSFFYKVDLEKCTLCGLCVKSCPNNNITIKNGKIKFSHRCDMCMRCSFFCPNKAIHIGMLDGWRVNNYYDIAKMDEEVSKMETPLYINKDSKGFYKCFVPYFENIDRMYESIYDKGN